MEAVNRALATWEAGYVLEMVAELSVLGLPVASLSSEILVMRSLKRWTLFPCLIPRVVVVAKEQKCMSFKEHSLTYSFNDNN